MKSTFRNVLVLLTVWLVAVSCATKPAAPPAAPEASQIQAEAKGLSPSGDERHRSISFALQFGSEAAIAAWKIEIVGSDGPVFGLDGTAADLPENLEWDGRRSDGSVAPEGSYTARLTIDYGATFAAGLATSEPFVLVTKTPTGSFGPDPGLIPYAGDGTPKELEVTVTTGKGLAAVSSWSIDVYGQDGTLFKQFEGQGPGGMIRWDGHGADGQAMASGVVYPATLTITDEFGSTGTWEGSFSLADRPTAPSASISLRRRGFSPTSVSVKNSIDLTLVVPAKAAVSEWQAEITSASRGVVRTYSGKGSDFPEYLRWDGRDGQGTLAGQGQYYAQLRLVYGSAYRGAEVRSPTFSLVLDPPTGIVSVDPAEPVLAKVGPASPIRFTIQAKSAYAQIAAWTLSVLDGDSRPLAEFKANWPNNKVEWDGKTLGGGHLTPGTSYEVLAKVEDEYGNVGTLKGLISVDPLESAEEPSAITAGKAGFAPKGDGSNPVMEFALTAGDPEAISSWKVDIRDSSGAVLRTLGSTSSAVPPKVAWDGKGDDGKWAPEGLYTARFDLDYGLRYSKVAVESRPFTLDLAPPAVSIATTTGLLSPDGDGENDVVGISLAASGTLGRPVSWSLSILDPGSNPFRTFKGSWPPAAITWDGTGADGSLVESAADYRLVAKVRDEFGNVGEAKGSVGTDILLIKTDAGFRIRVSSIVFKSFTADYRNVPPDRAARNLATLDLLAAKLAKFPDYRVRLEGHAVMINWDNKARGEAEQRAVLIPLSRARAEAVAAALVERGLPASMFETVGLGALNPVVPDSDYLNRWRNRRVEFILVK